MSYKLYNLPLILRICAIASLGGFILGYDASVISGAIEPLADYFQLSPAQSGWAVSNVIFGCIIGAYGVGFLANRIGRQKTLIVAAILFLISAVGSALSTTFFWFVAYRMLGGLAVGMASTATPLYTAEISPKEYRGRMLGLQQLIMVAGQVLVYVINFLIAYGMSNEWLIDKGWRWMLGSEAVPCIVFLALVAFLPESPRWQIMTGRSDKALSTLTRLSTAEHANVLLNEINTSIAEEKDIERQAKRTRLLSNPKLMYILLIGCSIAVLQQLFGINILMYYAPSLLQAMKVSTQDALLQTIFIGSANFIGILLAIRYVDQIGRVPLLRWGAFGCFATMLITACAIWSGHQGVLPVIGLTAFVLVFGFSWSLGAWLLISEMFPNRMRAVAMGMSFSTMYVANFLVAQTFPVFNRNPYLLEHFNGAFPLLICAAFCLVGFWFVHRFLPETKGVALEKIEPVMLSKSRRFGPSGPCLGHGNKKLTFKTQS
ncbi:SP family xylose:H+ symportor-like MFS transporter [Pseudomonas duriflava]|uniref:D-xylose-proton symporter n=1 Tax=Pseudomonas duriflava TaxID=459528 RepID=A0A562PPD7_9PSED|nr:sugar porter family MFS transporter [Pseudomonas duriflava]TWI46294.1 SP family xylose:H+ symportor-like MFS transporter [Pseudomonas duriflava]